MRTEVMDLWLPNERYHVRKRDPHLDELVRYTIEAVQDERCSLSYSTEITPDKGASIRHECLP